METRVTPGRIQTEHFIPLEIFRKKSNTFRGITFSHFYISLFGNAFKSSTICQKFFTEISLQMESAPRVGIPNEALKTMFTS